MALISLAGIAEAIDTLNLKEATLKGQLLQAIRARFPDAESLDTVTAIDPLDLIQELWGPEDAAEIKAKRKNLSSLKSSINKSLKDGITSGANPEGIIIGRDNVFIIADEKKNELLDKLSLDGEGGSSLLSALATLNALLSGAVSPNNQSEALKIIDQLDAARKSLSQLAGLPEDSSTAEKSPTGRDADGHMAVEEFEIDDDTVIEFVEEELPGPDHQQELSPTNGISEGDEGSAPMGDGGRGDMESDGHAALHGNGLTARGPATDDDGADKAAPGDMPAAGDHLPPGGQEEWDSFEVVDDDFDIVEQEDLTSQEEKTLENGAAVGADIDSIEEVAEVETEEDLEPIEEIATEEVIEQPSTPFNQALGRTEGLADELMPDSTSGHGGDSTDTGGGSAGQEHQEGDDWESFEVVDDDFDIVEEDALHGQEEESLEVTAPVADDLEIIEEAEEILASEPDLPAGQDLAPEGDGEDVELEEVEDVEAEAALEPDEEITAQEIIECEGDVEEITEEIPGTSASESEFGGDMGLGQAQTKSGGEAKDSKLTDDWDSFEVMDDDFDIVEEDTLHSQEEESLEFTAPVADDLEIIEEVEEILENEPDLLAGHDPGAEGDGEEVELEDVEDVEAEVALEPDEEITAQEILAYEEDVAEIDQEDLAAEPDLSAERRFEETEPEDGGDDWSSFKIDEDTSDFTPSPTMADAQKIAPKTPPMERSMDLSQYIDAEEALANNPDILQERSDEYIKQILERFMPKFIKIPKGLYPVGDRKKRKTDRPATKVNVVEFYIGQFPITNDLFDFFVRETGYETEAERIGHGLVTSGRLRNDLNLKTGSHTLAINKGIITRQIKGANWRHPDGPASSLESRSHHPVVQVSRLDAIAFATWAGKRLPSEDEWEVGARGKEGFLLPWGNDILPLANLEGHQAGSTTPVNYFGRQSMSPFGLLDMLGNVFEWTSSTYSGQNGRELYILKGGSWATSKITCAERLIEPASTWSNTIGFRCAVNAD
ncbi:MAG: formylglycine-generating enzyme family protein [Proteobacteria bacterium]|nr:formylglycine-generating enzyme family protein [Pseudomonadota bacterium]